MPSTYSVAGAISLTPSYIGKESYCCSLAKILKLSGSVGITKAVNQLEERAEKETRIVSLAAPQVLMGIWPACSRLQIWMGAV